MPAMRADRITHDIPLSQRSHQLLLSAPGLDVQHGDHPEHAMLGLGVRQNVGRVWSADVCAGAADASVAPQALSAVAAAGSATPRPIVFTMSRGLPRLSETSVTWSRTVWMIMSSCLFCVYFLVYTPRR